MYDACACTAPTALTDIPAAANRCIPGKIGKVIFQRRAEANNFDGVASPANPIDEAASWSALPDATNNTKVVITPYVEDFEFGEAGVLEDGENLDGAPIAVDSGPTPVSFMIRNISAAQFAALKELQCERDLVVYFVDANSNFFCRKVAANIHNGFVISPDTFVVSDPTRGSTKADQFKCMVQFKFASNWYAESEKVAPEAGFDPLTELAAT